MALASIRGFDITGWDQPPIKSTSHAPCNATNNQPEIMLQDVESRLNEIVVYLSERKLGFRLDNADFLMLNKPISIHFFPSFQAAPAY